MISVQHGLILFAAAFGAGIINAIAGGGTLLSFPALISIGLDPKIANATSTISLWPGLAGSLWGYRRELSESKPYMRPLALISLLGGIVGAYLLIKTPSPLFAKLVPFLILFATVLFVLQEPVSRWLRSRAAEANVQQVASDSTGLWSVTGFLIQFCAAVYGAYFGAGNGILILAALGLLGIHHIHIANGLKIFLAIWLNIVAIIGFILAGMIAWTPALIMSIGAVLGGYVGASTARRLNPKFVRLLVIFIGFGIGLLMLYRMW